MGSGLHPISLDQMTPLSDLLRVHIHIDDVKEEIIQTQKLLESWIECLHEAGVDLEEYGHIEADLYERGLVDWTFRIGETSTKMNMTRLAWGPSPSDWKIQLEVLEEEYDMPGGWIEEDQDESNRSEKGGTEDSSSEAEEEEGFVTGSEGNQEDAEEDADNEETAQEGHE